MMTKSGVSKQMKRKEHTLLLYFWVTRKTQLFFFFGHAYGMWKFQGQRWNPYHSSNWSLCSDNALSLICCTTRELSKTPLKKINYLSKPQASQKFMNKLLNFYSHKMSVIFSEIYIIIIFSFIMIPTIYSKLTLQHHSLHHHLSWKHGISLQDMFLGMNSRIQDDQGVPVVAQLVMNPTGIHEDVGLTSALLSGLRIQCCQ